MYIYLNGDIVEEKDAKISPLDYGYLYGIGLFETFRVYEGHPFLLDDHLERINNALTELNFNWKFHKVEVIEIIDQLLHINGWKNASIRLNISAGKGEPALRTLEFNEPTVLVYAGPLPESTNTLIEKKAQFLKTRRNSPEGIERWKSHQFMNNLLAKQEINDPTIEGIFLNTDNEVAEGITSNIFWVKGNTVYTPTIKTGILNGITRQYVLSLCEKLHIPFKDGRFTQLDVMGADEVFVTNSVQEIIAIQEIEDTSFTGCKGKVTTELFHNYKLDRTTRWTRKA